jgi:hypothetical protein
MTPEIRRLLDDWKALVARIHATLPEDGSSIYFENGKAWAYQQCIEQLDAALLALPAQTPSTEASMDYTDSPEGQHALLQAEEDARIAAEAPADLPPGAAPPPETIHEG